MLLKLLDKFIDKVNNILTSNNNTKETTVTNNIIKESIKQPIKSNSNLFLGNYDYETQALSEIFRAVKNYYPNSQLLHNIIIPKDDDGTAEIDGIIITPVAIVVVECKDYASKFYGDINNDMVSVYYGKQQKRVLNPIKQNKSHIYYLKKFLNIKNIPYINYVSLKNGYKFTNKDNVNICCFNTTALLANLYTYTDIVINPDIIATDILSRALSDKSSHTTFVNNKYKNNTVCPKCGGELVLRTNKNTSGQFYGCKNYPKCNYIKPINKTRGK